MMRIAALIGGLFLLCAASPPPEPAPVPDSLKPYVKGGVFDPGDFEWMRGAFADATPEQKAATDAVEAWVNQCLARGVARTKSALAAMGFAEPRLIPTAGADLVCRMYVSRPPAAPGETFAQFRGRLDRAMPIARTYLTAVETARESNRLAVSRDFQSALLGRPLAEQMLRQAFTWGEGAMRDAPPLPPGERSLFIMRLSMATAAEDHANTSWLKKIVAERGWPGRSQVGEGAASAAWLLVQHADADPVFQLQVLRLMEPLVAQGEVSKSNYAYLYDRIMLKLNGKQRYATQMTCAKGERVPLPLEDAQAVGRYRSEMGLNALDEYISGMNSHAGPCPPA